MPTIPFATLTDADNRSRELWTAVLGRAKRPQDVTEYAYSRTLLEDETPVLVVPERDTMLDSLIRADELTADELAALVDLYPLWSADSVDYALGDIRAHGGQLYRCVQPHVSQANFAPDVTPALWEPCAPEDVIPEWQQPSGAHDAYPAGYQVVHNGQVWESTVDDNVWEPGVYGWVAVNP